MDAIVFDFPVLIKSKVLEGRRIVTCEASNESVDSEGDAIMQSALMDSSASFIKTGHIDIDHLSEIGDQIGIKNPTTFIIGIPQSVEDLGEGRTGVTFEVFKSKDGSHDPSKNKYDEFWESLQTDPPTRWRASIYGFPKDDGIVECSKESCSSGATRYLVTKIDWRSLAMTRNPVNTSIKHTAKIVSVKSYTDSYKNSLTGSVPAQGGICKDMTKYLAWSLIDQTLNEILEGD